MEKTSWITKKTNNYKNYKKSKTKLFSELFDTIMCKINQIIRIWLHTTFLANQYHYLKLPHLTVISNKILNLFGPNNHGIQIKNKTKSVPNYPVWRNLFSWNILMRPFFIHCERVYTHPNPSKNPNKKSHQINKLFLFSYFLIFPS